MLQPPTPVLGLTDKSISYWVKGTSKHNTVYAQLVGNSQHNATTQFNPKLTQHWEVGQRVSEGDIYTLTAELRPLARRGDNDERMACSQVSASHRSPSQPATERKSTGNGRSPLLVLLVIRTFTSLNTHSHRHNRGKNPDNDMPPNSSQVDLNTMELKLKIIMIYCLIVH